MTVAPMKGAFYPAKGFSKGRNNGAVKWLVLHTAEGAKAVAELGHYFEGTTKGSSNAGVDSNGAYAEYVHYYDTPWTNPPINSQSDTLEMCAFRSWTRQQWLAHPKLLEATAHWIAWRCAVRRIPIRLISGAQAKSGMTGIMDHKRVNDAWHQSTHTDVGLGFPWDVVIARARQIAAVTPPKPVYPTIKEGDDNKYVAILQTALNKHGYHLRVDGNFGEHTKTALESFQHSKGLKPDGVCGPLTWHALGY
jgi:hypothetical protein